MSIVRRAPLPLFVDLACALCIISSEWVQNHRANIGEITAAALARWWMGISPGEGGRGGRSAEIAPCSVRNCQHGRAGLASR